MKAARELEVIADPERAGALLHPLRQEILRRAREPRSATEIAAELGLARQKVHYHVTELAEAGLLRKAGRRRKRNMIEQRWHASARAYVLGPEVLGCVQADLPSIEDRLGAAWLLANGARLHAELGRSAREAAAAGKRLSTLCIESELRFESTAQRNGFARALAEAVVRVVQEHASPVSGEDGTPGPGRPFRLMVGCWPVPPDSPAAPADSETRKPHDE